MDSLRIGQDLATEEKQPQLLVEFACKARASVCWKIFFYYSFNFHACSWSLFITFDVLLFSCKATLLVVNGDDDWVV